MPATTAQEKAKRHLLGLINALYEWKFGEPPSEAWWAGVKLIVLKLI